MTTVMLKQRCYDVVCLHKRHFTMHSLRKIEEKNQVHVESPTTLLSVIGVVKNITNDIVQHWKKALMPYANSKGPGDRALPDDAVRSWHSLFVDIYYNIH